jgi:hypothetical protein
MIGRGTSTFARFSLRATVVAACTAMSTAAISRFSVAQAVRMRSA